MAFGIRRSDPSAATTYDSTDDTVARLTAENDDLRRRLADQEIEHAAAIQRYALMIEAAGIGLWDMDVNADDPVNPDNEFQWSQEFRHMLGYTDERAIESLIESV